MADSPATPRRRFQFRLRTLMIGVTLFALIPCGYVGWQAKIVRERRSLCDAIKRTGGQVSPYRVEYGASVPVPQPNWLQRMLGDEPVGFVFVRENDELAEAAKLVFPDATIIDILATGPSAHDAEVVDAAQETSSPQNEATTRNRCVVTKSVRRG
jgi:hypothetical protein